MMLLPRKKMYIGALCLSLIATIGLAQQAPPLPSGAGEDFDPTSPLPSLSNSHPNNGVAEPSLPSANLSGQRLRFESGQEEVKISVTFQYVVERPVTETWKQGEKTQSVTRYVREIQSATLGLDTNLDELDLPPNGKRAAVLAITAARHDDLLNNLKEAETDEEKKAASDALKENYTAHYAIETWWREQRLADLEKRIATMNEQLKQRQEAQEKYVTAAMTIAELWADGIAIAPPKPNRTDGTTEAVPSPSNSTPTRLYGVPQGSPGNQSPVRGSGVYPGAFNEPQRYDSSSAGPAALPEPASALRPTLR